MTVRRSRGEGSVYMSTSVTRGTRHISLLVSGYGVRGAPTQTNEPFKERSASVSG